MSRILGEAFWGVALLLLFGLYPLWIDAQSPNRVGLVVRLGDGSLVTRCVEFAQEELSGYDILMQSGLQVVVSQSSGMGVTVCQIEGEGCPASNCFCGCSGATCTYWSYWRLAGDTWSYSPLGASGNRVRSGAVEGWVWGKGSDPPPVMTFEQICAPPAAATPLSTATPVPTNTPTLLPTATALRPTLTVQLAGTATASPTATWTPTAATLTASPTGLFVATPTGTATPGTPAATPSPTLSLQSAPATQASEPRPLPTVTPGQETPAVSSQDEAERSNYVLFGVLVAVLLGIAAVIMRLRKR